MAQCIFRVWDKAADHWWEIYDDGTVNGFPEGVCIFNSRQSVVKCAELHAASNYRLIFRLAIDRIKSVLAKTSWLHKPQLVK